MGMPKNEGGEIVLNTKWVVEKQMADEAAKAKQAADQANIDALKAKAAQGN
jgi:hypothetical protein